MNRIEELKNLANPIYNFRKSAHHALENNNRYFALHQVLWMVEAIGYPASVIYGLYLLVNYFQSIKS